MSSATICGWEAIVTDSPEEPWERHNDADASETDVCLKAEIERAEQTNSLEADSDEEAPVFSQDAFHRAKSFLLAQSRELRELFGEFAPVPQISPGPDGSVDLLWKEPNWGLLINIPSNDAPATFYGDNSGVQRIKGSFDPRICNMGIIRWLSKC